MILLNPYLGLKEFVQAPPSIYRREYVSSSENRLCFYSSQVDVDRNGTIPTSSYSTSIKLWKGQDKIKWTFGLPSQTERLSYTHAHTPIHTQWMIRKRKCICSFLFKSLLLLKGLLLFPFWNASTFSHFLSIHIKR